MKFGVGLTWGRGRGGGTVVNELTLNLARGLGSIKIVSPESTFSFAFSSSSS